MWSLSRFTSSMYNSPRWAAAKRPGSKCFSPIFKARSISSVPTTRSSVAPRGNSTRAAGRSKDCLSIVLTAQCGQTSAASAGAQPKGHPATTSISGSKCARARTAVDFAVPLCPRISTPPIVGLMAFSRSASLMDSCPTMAVNGKTTCVRITVLCGMVKSTWSCAGNAARAKSAVLTSNTSTSFGIALPVRRA